MSNDYNENKLRCIVEQLKQEKRTKEILDNTLLSDGRKEQIIDKRKAEVRRNFGLSMDKNIKI
jgi:hypothetical protein